MERARASGSPFPLVLLDAMMPDVDGFDLAERIRRRPGLAGATLMMLSSAGRPGEAAHCRDLGLAACLTKPVKQSELLDTIMNVLDVTPLPARAAPAETPRSAPGPAGRPLRLLLAEDNAVNQRLAVRLLEKRGHAVTLMPPTAGRPLEALGQGPFDVVLMDVQMPEMDGFEATAAIRGLERGVGGPRSDRGDDGARDEGGPGAVPGGRHGRLRLQAPPGPGTVRPARRARARVRAG